MLNNLKYFLAVVVFLPMVCARQEISEQKPPMEEKSKQIREIIGKLQPLTLPYRYDFSNEMEAAAIKIDYPYQSKTFPGWEIDHVIGYLPDTSNWFAVVGLGFGADFAFPFLFITDKQGKQTDDILLSVSQCGSGGQYFCDANSVLENGNQFELHSLAIAIAADLNDDGEILPADTTEMHATGWITSEGKVKMTLGEKPGTK
jgi:hypothetical protein